jgi:FixJ family two-component response regulator
MATNSILLVDDDELIRSALCDLLSHKGRCRRCLCLRMMG